MILSTQVALAYALSLAALPAQAYKIPANLQAFYDKHKVSYDGSLSALPSMLPVLIFIDCLLSNQ